MGASEGAVTSENSLLISNKNSGMNT